MLAQPRIPLLPLHTKELYWPPREWTHSQLAAVFAFISPTTSTTTSWGFPLQSRKDLFIFTSTNKVYGDTPNYLPLVELETRWEIEEGHVYRNGIPETMSIDQSQHSLFGASKVAADILVQEYGRYFGIKSGIFRGGCFTGPNHSGAMLHGFLAYLMKCVVTGRPYTVFGYKGKQVRDNIHSHDLINVFSAFYQAPFRGGGGLSFFGFSHLSLTSLCCAHVRSSLLRAENVASYAPGLSLQPSLQVFPAES